MSSSTSQKLILALLVSAALVVTCSSSRPHAEGPEPNDNKVKLFGVTVVITNTLERKQNLQVHCKEKGHDYGVHQLPYATIYSLSTSFSFRGDYYCGFVFDNKLHWFDIYLSKRDWGRCTGDTCVWFVQEGGPCFSDPNTPSKCYPWNHDSRDRSI